jgi:hypothetical protein
MGLTGSPIQWLCNKAAGGVMLITHLHLVSTLRMRGGIQFLPPIWYGQRQLYVCCLT